MSNKKFKTGKRFRSEKTKKKIITTKRTRWKDLVFLVLNEGATGGEES